jgi:Cu-Zn family superoxide dismutase
MKEAPMKLLALGVALVSLAGCASMSQTPVTNNRATAELRNASGQVAGTATFTQTDGGVLIVVEAKGLPPGPKGVHIHEVGKCEPPQFTSAGGHFNPGKKQHGSMNPQGPHAGDLPNMTVAQDGTGRMETTTDRVTLNAGGTSLFDADGSALVVHAGPDDFRTDPTGNSGGRSLCGVVTKPGS